MIEAVVNADSVNIAGNRITTFVLTYPRFIHSEVMTHRMFSRNAASSRAIPVQKMMNAIRHTPAGPVVWGMNQKGMQAGEELTGWRKWLAKKLWKWSSRTQLQYVRAMNWLGVHKQIANRLVEPFAHMTTLVTATEFGNFFNLRCHKDAQPEFQELAFEMLLAYEASDPVIKQPGEWHLPFADKHIDPSLTLPQRLKIVTARAARTSYVNFDGDFAPEKDFKLHDDLAANGHWSPFEHAAEAMTFSLWSGNFCGWYQYRKQFQNEHQRAFDFDELKKRRKLAA